MFSFIRQVEQMAPGPAGQLRPLELNETGQEMKMAETGTKLPVKTENTAPAAEGRHTPFEMLRQEIDRLFDDFRPFGWGGRLDVRLPSIGRNWALQPAVDLVESEKEFEITAELPGMDEKDIQIEVSDRRLVIKGQKSESKEEKEKNYYLSERYYGSFQRAFQLPDSVDRDKIEASFSKGILSVRMPKGAKVARPAKKIEVKAE